jgi:hypothetical protein
MLVISLQDAKAECTRIAFVSKCFLYFMVLINQLCLGVLYVHLFYRIGRGLEYCLVSIKSSVHTNSPPLSPDAAYCVPTWELLYSSNIFSKTPRHTCVSN